MRRRIALIVYAAALVASAVYQTARPGAPVPSPSDRTGALDPQTAVGPVAGAPVRLVYEDDGAGPPVVLLHGSPGAIADFRHLSPHLTGRFRVLVPDLPGFGRSDRWLPDYLVAAHARYVLAWLDTLGVGEFQAVGFSQGGGVELHMAELAPGGCGRWRWSAESAFRRAKAAVATGWNTRSTWRWCRLWWPGRS